MLCPENSCPPATEEDNGVKGWVEVTTDEEYCAAGKMGGPDHMDIDAGCALDWLTADATDGVVVLNTQPGSSQSGIETS